MSVLELASAQASEGADVWIASLKEGGSAPPYGPLTPGEDVHLAEWRGRRPVGWRGARLHLMARSERASLRPVEPDIVHAHGEFNPDNWWAGRLFDCPLVLAPHGAFHPAVRARGAASKRLYVTVARRAMYRRITRFHALTPAEAQHIDALLPGSSVYCLPNASSAGAWPSAASDGPLDARAPVRFLFLGRMDVAAKGLDVLLEAFAAAARRSSVGRRLTLSLVGPDHRGGKLRLRSLAERAGIADLVETSGPVTTAEVPVLMQGFHVYVQLSRNDAFPRSVGDALALGMPAIISHAVGLASYDEISRQPHVKLVSPTVSDAAAAIANTAHEIETLRAAARRARPELSHFLSADRIARLHLREYEAILGGGRR